MILFARCCPDVFDVHSKNLQITSKLLTQGYRYYKFLKHLECSSGQTLSFYPKLMKYRFKNMFLIESLTRSSTVIFVSSGSKIVKRLRRRKYDPVIIERTIDLELDPSTALYKSFLKHCTLINKAIGTISRDLS